MSTPSYKTVSANKQTVDKKWVVVDATNKVLGRMSSQIASILRGKHKTYFTPHVDCGDHVVVINAEKVRLTGKKMEDKQYVWHTGYPGGQRSTTPKAMMINSPERVVEKAVKNMLPKSKLGRQMFTNLHVYSGDQHPHAAQEPKKLEI